MTETSKAAAFLAALLLTAGACASPTRAVVCAKEGAGQSYHVDATLATGMDLNSVTGTMQYQPLSNYVVIFWKPHEATIIDIGAFQLSNFPSSGHDQEGRSWQVNLAWGACL